MTLEGPVQSSPLAAFPSLESLGISSDELKVDVPASLDPRFLWEEYKLLQDKVDKIGTFRFQVKSWLIPLSSAWAVAIYTAHLPPWTNLFSLIFLLAFWLLEENQTQFQNAALNRIKAINMAASEIASPSQTNIPLFARPARTIANMKRPRAEPNLPQNRAEGSPVSVIAEAAARTALPSKIPSHLEEAIELAEEKAWWLLKKNRAHHAFYLLIALTICTLTQVWCQRAAQSTSPKAAEVQAPPPVPVPTAVPSRIPAPLLVVPSEGSQAIRRSIATPDLAPAARDAGAHPGSADAGISQRQAAPPRETSTHSAPSPARGAR